MWGGTASECMFYRMFSGQGGIVQLHLFRPRRQKAVLLFEVWAHSEGSNQFSSASIH